MSSASTSFRLTQSERETVAQAVVKYVVGKLGPTSTETVSTLVQEVLATIHANVVQGKRNMQFGFVKLDPTTEGEEHKTIATTLPTIDAISNYGVLQVFVAVVEPSKQDTRPTVKLAEAHHRLSLVNRSGQAAVDVLGNEVTYHLMTQFGKQHAGKLVVLNNQWIMDEGNNYARWPLQAQSEAYKAVATHLYSKVKEKGTGFLPITLRAWSATSHPSYFNPSQWMNSTYRMVGYDLPTLEGAELFLEEGAGRQEAFSFDLREEPQPMGMRSLGMHPYLALNPQSITEWPTEAAVSAKPPVGSGVPEGQLGQLVSKVSSHLRSWLDVQTGKGLTDFLEQVLNYHPAAAKAVQFGLHKKSLVSDPIVVGAIEHKARLSHPTYHAATLFLPHGSSAIKSFHLAVDGMVFGKSYEMVPVEDAIEAVTKCALYLFGKEHEGDVAGTYLAGEERRIAHWPISSDSPVWKGLFEQLGRSVRATIGRSPSLPMLLPFSKKSIEVTVPEKIDGWVWSSERSRGDIVVYPMAGTGHETWTTLTLDKVGHHGYCVGRYVTEISLTT